MSRPGHRGGLGESVDHREQEEVGEKGEQHLPGRRAGAGGRWRLRLILDEHLQVTNKSCTALSWPTVYARLTMAFFVQITEAYKVI